MIYIYSNGDYHTDKQFAEEVLHLGDPVSTMPEDEFNKVFRGQILIVNGVVTFPNHDEDDEHRNRLQAELYKIDSRLRELDYIGIKIATGRGTKEEYAAEIAEMQVLADRKNVIQAEMEEIRR